MHTKSNQSELQVLGGTQFKMGNCLEKIVGVSHEGFGFEKLVSNGQKLAEIRKNLGRVRENGGDNLRFWKRNRNK